MPLAGFAAVAVAIVAVVMAGSGQPPGDWIPAVAGTAAVALVMVAVVAVASRSGGGRSG